MCGFKHIRPFWWRDLQTDRTTEGSTSVERKNSATGQGRKLHSKSWRTHFLPSALFFPFLPFPFPPLPCPFSAPSPPFPVLPFLPIPSPSLLSPALSSAPSPPLPFHPFPFSSHPPRCSYRVWGSSRREVSWDVCGTSWNDVCRTSIRRRKTDVEISTIRDGRTRPIDVGVLAGR